MPISEKMVVESDTRQKAIIDTPHVLQGENQPDAVFCVNDDCAAGVLHAAHILGVDIPNELAVCGFSDAPICRATKPMLTTVQQHGADIGRRAMMRLLDRLNGEGKYPRTEMVPTDLIVRETTK
jgi:DNA-binding LacI/PurR family transcriptional regulator